MKSIQLTFSAVVLMLSVNAKAQTYQFNHEAQMEVKMASNGETKQSMEYKFLFPEEGDYYGAEVSMSGIKAKSIFDMSKMTMTTLMDQGGMKMGMQYDLNKAFEMTGAEQSNGDAEVKKTGEKKDILGYTCYQYLITSDDGGYTEAWLTNELDLANVYSGFAALSKNKNTIADMPEGFLMQLISWPKGKEIDEKLEMKAIAINLNQASSISADGYSIMKLN